MISYDHLTDFLKSDFLFPIHFSVIVNGKNIDFLAFNLDNKFDLKRKSVDLIGIIHRFSHLVTLLFHKWLHVRLNHKDACIF
jgi:hypothetical protein